MEKPIHHAEDSFKCTICLFEPQDPHLCPHCSHLYCYDCISSWLSRSPPKDRRCPSCRAGLPLEKLVKVRWFEAIRKLLRNSPEPKPGGICPLHLQPLSHYCSSCESSVCDINFRSTNEQFKQVKAYAKGLNRTMELVNKMKEDRIAELRTMADRAIAEIEKQFSYKLRLIQEQNNALQIDVKNSEQAFNQLKKEAMGTNSQQYAVSVRRSKLCEQLSKTLTSIRVDRKRLNVPISCKVKPFPSTFETGIFVVENRPWFCQPDAFHEDFVFPGNFDRTWRLLVASNVDKLEIFLELVRGSPCCMDCRIQLLHVDVNKIIRKSVIVPFRIAMSRHILDSVELKTIMEEGYRREDGSLELLYSIHPCEEPKKP